MFSLDELSLFFSSGENHALLTRLADHWLAAGATAFGVWHTDTLVRVWPPGTTVARPDLVAPLMLHGRSCGQLGVVGLESALAQARLAVDADLVNTILQNQVDLEAMIGDLSENQDQLLALYELAQSMRSQLDTGELVQAVTRQAMRLTKARAAFTWLVTADHPPIYQFYPAPLLPFELLPKLFQRANQSANPVLLTATDLPKHLVAGVENLYLIPIQLSGVTIAALGLLFDRSAAALSPDLKLGQAIARQAEVYFENVLLHEDALKQTRLRTELSLARQIQFSLLPQKLPQLPGLDMYAAMRPAEEVGGDFYTFAHRPDTSLAFTIADAAGKGMPAAMLMSMTHTIISSAARFMPILTPKLLIGRAIQDLYDNFTETGLFVTLFAGQYFSEGRCLRFANAGHSPVIFCPAHAPAHLLEADAPPMGVLPDNLCEDFELCFEIGDVLIAATDGFSEAVNPANEMFSYQRLLDLAKALADRPAREIAAAFYQAMDDFQGNQPQRDDQTIIVLKGIPK